MLSRSGKYKDGWVCDWFDVRSVIRYDKLVTHEMLNGQYSEKSKNRFTCRSEVSNYQTRNSDKLQLTKEIFCFSTAKSWNNMPKTIRGFSDMPIFKKHLKAYLQTLNTPKKNP